MQGIVMYRATQLNVESLEDRRVLSGVTIITHGYQPGLGPSESPPEWTSYMGEAILDRAGAFDPAYGTLLHHDSVGFWDWWNPLPTSSRRSFDPNQEVVCIFNWAAESDLGDDEGGDWLEAAADSLFASLLETFPSGTWGDPAEQSLFDLATDANDETLLNFHFIGHSRGGVVNTLVTQRFHEYFPWMTVDHVTTLDPHPAYGTVFYRFYDPWSDPDERQLPTFENVAFADNYYQEEGSYEKDFGFNGVTVVGAHEKLLDQSALVKHASAIEHSDVHTWYHGTIDQSPTAFDGDHTISVDVRQDWYPNNDYSEGFAYSRIAGATGRPSVAGKTDPRETPGTPTLETVVNGNFDSGDLVGNKIPGWGYHGGGGTGHIDSASVRYLELDAGDNDFYRRHNPIYISPDVIGVEYDYWINDADFLFPNDTLKVLLGDKVIDTISLEERTGGFRRNARALFDFSHDGFVDMLEFRIDDGGDAIQSQVRIDNVELISAASPFESDSFEPNDSINDASVLGSEEKVTLRDLTIHDAGDVDFFRVTAAGTGKLIVNAVFEHDAGDLSLTILDANANEIASATSTDDKERLVIPVVGQQVYYVEVDGSGGATNQYALEIENFPAPIPGFVDLPARDQFHFPNDTGSSQHDNITSRTEPEILVQADLSNFAEEGITILNAAEAVALDAVGASVEVFVNGNSVGFADPVANTDNTLFRYTFAQGQLPVEAFPADNGWLHYVTAAVRIIDGQQDGESNPAPASGRTQLSKPLVLRIESGEFKPMSGLWTVDREGLNSRYRGASDPKANAIAQFMGVLPPATETRSFEVTINAEEKIPGSRWSNAFIAFDFDPNDLSDFKFAGAFKGVDRWAIGHSASNAKGYVADALRRERIDANSDCRIRVTLEPDLQKLQTTVILKVHDGWQWQEKMRHTYNELFADGVGLLTMRGIASFDDFADPPLDDLDADVVVAAPNAVPVAGDDRVATAPGKMVDIDVLAKDDFDEGAVLEWDLQLGAWQITHDPLAAYAGDRAYLGKAPADGNAIVAQEVDEVFSNIEVAVSFNADRKIPGRQWSNAFVIFDYLSPTDFKFAGAFVGINQWAIGHYAENANGYVVDKVFSEKIDAVTDYAVQVLLEDDTVTLAVHNGWHYVPKATHTYSDSGNLLHDGLVGLGTMRGSARFDDLRVKSSDRIFGDLGSAV